MADKKSTEVKQPPGPKGPLWQFYKVRFDFITRLCASVPAETELIKKWLESREPKMKPPGARSIDEVNEEVLASLPEEQEEVSGLVFQRNNGQLCVRSSTLRSHWKECARIISSYYVGKIQGESSFNVKVKNCVYHDETVYWTPLFRPDGTPIIAADGTKEKPFHATVKGMPVNGLKLFEYVEPASLEFTIKVLGGVVKQRDLETIFEYGGTHGYGGERSDGEGRYVFKIERIEQRQEDRGNGHAKSTEATTQDDFSAPFSWSR